MEQCARVKRSEVMEKLTFLLTLRRVDVNGEGTVQCISLEACVSGSLCFGGRKAMRLQ